jgi:hypothetical protein
MARTKNEAIEVSYQGRKVVVFTCLSAEGAAELRSRWQDGVVVLERIRDTPALIDDNNRSWLIRTASRLLGIKDWQAIDRECTGRTEYPRVEPVARELRLPKVQGLPAELAPQRVSRGDRLRGARSPSRGSGR